MGNSCIRNRVDNSDKKLSNDNILIDWKAKNYTQKYHWWPMCERNFDDVNNNLFAPSGGLGKYDELFNTNSVEIQRNKYYRNKNSRSLDKNWAGFCNDSAILSCLYPYPKKPVYVYYKNKNMLFKPRDIEALMILCTENAVMKNISMFFGERFNKKNINDKDEPYPTQLLKMLEIISKQEEPFVMDIDNGEAVWNYSYDKILVTKHKECLIEGIIPTEEDTEFLNFKIESTGYPDKNLDLWGYVKTKKLNNRINLIHFREAWITPEHPDFVWKTFKNEEHWKGKSEKNPEIDSAIVYQIYKHSFEKENRVLNF